MAQLKDFAQIIEDQKNVKLTHDKEAAKLSDRLSQFQADVSAFNT